MTPTPYAGGLSRLAFTTVAILALFAAALALIQRPVRLNSSATTSESRSVVP